ncbi:hypothetical protein COCMIDRAFT_26751 [Bipolaris oryzae ATCC 44560]|uniref:Uncharacterized protein n=1 Tax=Bipolaris oryzae ATCC 44560 TaxID=930090 RepID=W6Z4S9_COCMI|nr:uncharacterized protein COCMIDRAFT_26751 [Bipolaris oryzae ATCC 44560]EUC44985.1 hypothetical protein COCMIDRAFT_26751 [Bipolaris oryzae ATCC 44560]
MHIISPIPNGKTTGPKHHHHQQQQQAYDSHQNNPQTHPSSKLKRTYYVTHARSPQCTAPHTQHATLAAPTGTVHPTHPPWHHTNAPHSPPHSHSAARACALSKRVDTTRHLPSRALDREVER